MSKHSDNAFYRDLRRNMLRHPRFAFYYGMYRLWLWAHQRWHRRKDDRFSWLAK